MELWEKWNGGWNQEKNEWLKGEVRQVMTCYLELCIINT